ncbi:MAG: hypothetical protein KA746_14030 [Pyrinomonadaceae bacterium]|nr:hypothetical protein [Pyrinomonadaceae bacterium]MBP6211812.1 hypothetical protein [Pyrinomonadaceae bacterium]
MKKLISTFVLAAVLTLGSSFALAGEGIIVAGLSDNTCSQAANTKDGIIVAGLTDGIIVAGFTGIIVAGLTGIIVAGFSEAKDEPTVNCGIIVAG